MIFVTKNNECKMELNGKLFQKVNFCKILTYTLVMCHPFGEQTMRFEIPDVHAAVGIAAAQETAKKRIILSPF
jgi:hypothetical protein